MAVVGDRVKVNATDPTVVSMLQAHKVAFRAADSSHTGTVLAITPGQSPPVAAIRFDQPLPGGAGDWPVGHASIGGGAVANGIPTSALTVIT